MAVAGYSRPVVTTDEATTTDAALLRKIRYLQHRIAAISNTVVIDDLETETTLTEIDLSNE